MIATSGFAIPSVGAQSASGLVAGAGAPGQAVNRVASAAAWAVPARGPSWASTPKLAGKYTQHAGDLTIKSSGRAYLSYQVQSNVGASFPEVSLRAVNRSGKAATFRVVASDDPRLRVNRKVRISRTSYGVHVSGLGHTSGVGRFCNARHFAAGDCGA